VRRVWGLFALFIFFTAFGFTEARLYPDAHQKPSDISSADQSSTSANQKLSLGAGLGLHSGDPNSKTADDKGDSKSESSADLWTAIFTGLLVIVGVVQAGLFLWQLRLIRDSLSDAKTAADAAKKSADTAERTLTDLEAPFLFPVIPTGTAEGIDMSFGNFRRYDHPTSVVQPVRPRASILIHNFGRSPAILRSVSISMDHWAVMPDNPIARTHSGAGIEPMLEAGSRTVRPIQTSVGQPIDRDAFRRIENGTARIFLYGQITFADVFGTDHIQAYCLAWDARSKAFIPWEAKFNRRKRHNQQ